MKNTVVIADELNNNKVLDVNTIGSGILDKLLEHLNLNHQVLFSSENSAQLKEIKIFRSIRNAITHNGSRLHKKDIKKCLPKITQHNLTFNRNNGQLKVDNISFLKEFHTLILDFGTEINKKMINNYR